MKISRLLIDALETFPNFVIVDRIGNIVYLNKGYAKLLGIDRDFAIGKPVTNVIPGTRMMEILKTGKQEIGSLMTLYDHTIEEDIYVVCNRMPIVRNGRIVGAAAVTTMEDIIVTVTNLNEELDQIKKENESYKKELDILLKAHNSLEAIIGESDIMKDIKKDIEDFAKSNLSILITGETGVGKELFAKAIHELSNRRLNNYVKINCAAIPSELLESELFGYESGAFSGASKGGKIGKFELANNGTLLLDEIGEMPMTLQSKLLRVLQEQELERVGGVKTIPINVRVVCCTNQNIMQLIEEKKFRKDLYYRINTVELAIPPLRQRLSDIPALCQLFIDKSNLSNHTHVEGIDSDVIDLFQQYSWPGNVRELEHVMERLITLNSNQRITMDSCGFLKKRIMPNPIASRQSLNDIKQDSEREAILRALRESGGNKSRAARILGIDRSLLYYKMKKLGL